MAVGMAFFGLLVVIMCCLDVRIVRSVLPNSATLLRGEGELYAAGWNNHIAFRFHVESA